jgi:hypothetical protein
MHRRPVRITPTAPIGTGEGDRSLEVCSFMNFVPFVVKSTFDLSLVGIGANQRWL